MPMTTRGPLLSISRPATGASSADSRNPNENAPAISPRSQPNSSISGGSSSENAVRAVTAIAMVTNATATISQP
jgi:hypothetical protein